MLRFPFWLIKRKVSKEILGEIVSKVDCFIAVEEKNGVLRVTVVRLETERGE